MRKIPWVVIGMFFPIQVNAGSLHVNVVASQIETRSDSAKVLEKQARHGEALPVYEDLYAEMPEKSIIDYYFKRLLATPEGLTMASYLLDRAIKLRNEKNLFHTEPLYNAKGYVLMRQKEYEQSLEFFDREMSGPIFESRPAAEKIKVYNNKGLALLELDRYEEAREQFELAERLGSTFAQKNLRIVDSIVETLERGDKNLRSIFVPVIGNSKSKDKIPENRSRLAKVLECDESAVRIFLNTAKSYVFTLTPNLSYVEATQIVKSMRSKGLSAAFVASNLRWEEVSGRFPPETQQ